MTDVAMTTDRVPLPPTSSASDSSYQIMVPTIKKGKERGSRKSSKRSSIDGAVYAYIRAVRALGREQVNTLEISKALGLPRKVIEEAAARLGSRGVKRS